MNRAIYVMPATGGAPRLLAPKPIFDRGPIWSPDGQSIYFLLIPLPISLG